MDDDPSLGGYCCRKCHWRQSTGSKTGKPHDVSCKKREPPFGSIRALPTPPRLAYESADGNCDLATKDELEDPSARISLACASNCGFLLSEDVEMGGYCCRRCHYRHATGERPRIRHVECLKLDAPLHVRRAPPVPPRKPSAGKPQKKDTASCSKREAPDSPQRCE